MHNSQGFTNRDFAIRKGAMRQLCSEGTGRGGDRRWSIALAGVHPDHAAHRVAWHSDRGADHRAVFLERIPDRHDVPAEGGPADRCRLVLPSKRTI